MTSNKNLIQSGELLSCPRHLRVVTWLCHVCIVRCAGSARARHQCMQSGSVSMTRVTSGANVSEKVVNLTAVCRSSFPSFAPFKFESDAEYIKIYWTPIRQWFACECVYAYPLTCVCMRRWGRLPSLRVTSLCVHAYVGTCIQVHTRPSVCVCVRVCVCHFVQESV